MVNSKFACLWYKCILWLNWRDIRNPEADGAEVYTHEVIKRLAQKVTRWDSLQGLELSIK
jgi:hypothetical protein